MDQGQSDVALRATEVPMLEPEIVRQIRGLAAMSWGSKRIAATLGISRSSCSAVPARCGAGSAGEAASATARWRSAQGRRGRARRRGGRQCGGGAAAARRAWDRRGAADAPAGSRAAPPSSARRRGGDDSLRDGARASAPDRLRRATCRHQRSRDTRLLLRRRTRLFETDLRAGILARATRRLARGPLGRVPALRRRHANGARRQCSRADSRARHRDWRRACTPGIHRVLRRLGRRAARVPPVSSKDEGQDGVRRRLRQAQCDRGPQLREFCGARGASRDVDHCRGREDSRHDARAASRPLRA